LLRERNKLDAPGFNDGSAEKCGEQQNFMGSTVHVIASARFGPSSIIWIF